MTPPARQSHLSDSNRRPAVYKTAQNDPQGPQYSVVTQMPDERWAFNWASQFFAALADQSEGGPDADLLALLHAWPLFPDMLKKAIGDIADAALGDGDASDLGD